METTAWRIPYAASTPPIAKSVPYLGLGSGELRPIIQRAGDKTRGEYRRERPGDVRITSTALGLSGSRVVRLYVDID